MLDFFNSVLACLESSHMIFDSLLFPVKDKILHSDNRSQLISLGINVIRGCYQDSIRDFVANWKVRTDKILVPFQTIDDPLSRV